MVCCQTCHVSQKLEPIIHLNEQPIIFPNPVPQSGTPQFLINNLKKEINLPEVTIYNVSKGTQVYSDLRPTIQVNEKVSITKALESGSYVLQIILPDTQEKLLGRFLVE